MARPADNTTTSAKVTTVFNLVFIGISPVYADQAAKLACYLGVGVVYA